MKLHLPKMLLTAVLAAVTLAPAWGEGTYNLLSPKGWNLNGYAYDYANNCITKSNPAWGNAKTAISPSRFIYTVGDDNTLDFSFTFKSVGAGVSAATASNYILYFLLQGEDDTIAIGGDQYSATTMGYGTTAPTNLNTTVLTPFTSDSDSAAPRAWDKDYTVTGTVTYANSAYTLNLEMLYDGTAYTSEPIDLGSTFNLNSFGMYGIAAKDTLSALSITGNMSYGEYEATISGEMSIDDVEWNRRGTSYTSADITMTDGSNYLGLHGSGESAIVTFAENTDLKGIDILSGKVTLKGSNNITASELVILENATATIGTGTTMVTTVDGINLGTGSKLELAKDSALDLTGDSLGNGVSGKRIDQVLDYLNTNLDTADGAYIKLALGNQTGGGTVADNQELRLGTRGSNLALNQNFEFTTALVIHGNAAKNASTDGKVLAINQGATLKLNKAGQVVSQSILNINGGNLIAQEGIALGHSVNENGKYWGKLTMSSGSIQSGTISFRNKQGGNAVDIDGGSLEFTAENAFGYDYSSGEESVDISIDDATLVAKTKDWTLDGRDASKAFLRGVTIAAENTKNITLKNVSLGTVTNNQKLTLGSGVTLDAGATLGGTGTTTLAALLTNNGTINGTLKIESLAGFEHGVGEIKDGNYTNNGFMVTDYTIIGGTNKSGVTVSYGGTTYTTSADGQIETADRTHYQITNTTNAEKVSDINAISSVTKISMNDGTTLNVNTATSSALNLLGDATLNITNVKTTTESGTTTTTTTLNHSAVTIASGAKATITGDGVYNIETSQIHATQEATASPLNVEFDSETWTGQLNIVASTENGASVEWLNLNHYGNAESTIKLKGVKGYLCNATAADGVTFASDIIMENSNLAALELSNGFSADHFIFSGNISNGSNAGNFVKASKVQQDFTFSGDISSWTGQINLRQGELKNEKITTLTFTGNATKINNSVIQTQNQGDFVVKAKVRIDNTQAVTVASGIEHNNDKEGSELHLEVDTAKGTTFSKAVKVTDVTLDDASKAIFKKGLTANAMTLGESAMLIANADMSGALTAGAGSAVIVTTSLPTSITSITVTGSATLQTGGAEGGLGTSLVFANNSKLTINGEGSVNLGGALTLGSNIVLNEALMNKIGALEEGAGLALFNNVTALTLLADEASPVALMSLTTDAIDAADVFSGLTADTYTVDLTGNTVSINKLITPVTPSVPEPTTATLSLLALAGLAARRRRK